MSLVIEEGISTIEKIYKSIGNSFEVNQLCNVILDYHLQLMLIRFITIMYLFCLGFSVIVNKSNLTIQEY